MNTNSLSFSPKPLYADSNSSYGNRKESIALRNYLFEKFKRHITLLLEQKKTRKVASRKGYLNPRVLYKYSFSDNVFQKSINHQSSDTTIVFLIDGSGSMESLVNTPVGQVTAMEMCGAVASAFAKANDIVLKGKIPIEVFIKSAPSVSDESLTGTKNGGLVTLTRVFSSHTRVKDFDKLCTLRPRSPIVDEDGYSDGSYTSEYAILPALNKWIKGNVKTKKCIVFNLTDGETYCTIGNDGFQFRNQDTKAMRLKYLRGLPNVTLMLNERSDRYGGSDHLKDTYGDNMLLASEDFSGALFKVFAGFLD